MSNNITYWGRKFGFYEPRSFIKNSSQPFGLCLGISGFGAKPRTNRSNPNRPQTLQSKRDKQRYEEYVKKHGLPVKYFKSNGTLNAEKTRNNTVSINSV